LAHLENLARNAFRSFDRFIFIVADSPFIDAGRLKSMLLLIMLSRRDEGTSETLVDVIGTNLKPVVCVLKLPDSPACSPSMRGNFPSIANV
jgi:hypothetical protein